VAKLRLEIPNPRLETPNTCGIFSILTGDLTALQAFPPALSRIYTFPQSTCLWAPVLYFPGCIFCASQPVSRYIGGPTHHQSCYCRFGRCTGRNFLDASPLPGDSSNPSPSPTTPPRPPALLPSLLVPPGSAQLAATRSSSLGATCAPPPPPPWSRREASWPGIAVKWFRW